MAGHSASKTRVNALVSWPSRLTWHGAGDRSEEPVRGLRLIWPWQDRTHGFSWLKAGTFALMFLPAIWLIDQVATEQFGPVPLGGMTFWSGVWATAILLLALAIT